MLGLALGVVWRELVAEKRFGGEGEGGGGFGVFRM